MRPFTVLLALTISLTVLADQRGLRGENRTGVWWKTLEVAEKATYITGVLDGEFLGGLYALPKKSDPVPEKCRAEVRKNYLERSSILSDTPVREVIRRLDLFFAAPANGSVMVPSAVYYLSRVDAKDSAEKLEKLLIAIRKNEG
jgi:hypothetical protein